MTDPFITIEKMLYTLFFHKIMDGIVILDHIVYRPGHLTVENNHQTVRMQYIFSSHLLKQFPYPGGIIVTEYNIRLDIYNASCGSI